MLSKLYDLQQLEAEERHISEEKSNSAELLALREVKQAFEVKKQSYLRLQAGLESLLKEQERLPGELAEMKEKRDGESAAIYDGSITSTKALTARETQLAALEDHLHEIEERLGILDQEIKQREDAVAELKAEMEEQYLEFRRLKAICLEKEADHNKRIEDLQRQQEELLPQINAEDMEWFRREQRRFNGTPIAKLSQEQVCSGCHTKVPPAIFTRTIRLKSTICDNCGRILFIDERDYK